MAGAGYKLFNTGDVLTAAQVNTYLQEQAVMRFANATARTTALSGVLAEGMMSYLDDTNTVEVYNGSAWVSVGSTGDITAVTTAANSGLTGGATSGDVALRINTTAKGSIIAGSGASTLAELTVGANNTVLTADSSTATGLKWATVSGGGYTSLATGSLSGSASITISSISTSYVDLVLYLYGVNTNGNACFFALNGDRGSNYGGVGHRFYNNANNAIAYNTSGFTSLINTTGDTTPDNNATGNVTLDLPNYAVTTGSKTTRCSSYWVSNGGYKTVVQATHAYVGTAAAITSIEIFTGGGNFTAGTYVLYGVK